MQSEVPWFPLEEIVEDILDRRGITPLKLGGEFSPAGHRVISAKVVKGGRVQLDADEPRYVNESIYQKWMRTPLRRGDVVMTSEAPLGELAFIDKDVDWVLGQRLFAIRPKPGRLHGRFLYYALQTENVRADIFGRASGTTVQGIRQSELRRVQIPLPNFVTQIEVADLLGSLDDRIDLLRQTNATLESIAQALFKSWFIDFDPVRAKADGREPGGMDAATAALFPAEFEESALGVIPKGWVSGKLDAICTNPRVQAKPGQMPADTTYIGLEHMPRRSIALDNVGTADGLGSGKFWFERSDVLFGKLRPYFHKVGLAPCRGVCSTDILVLRPKAGEWLGFLAMHASSDALISYATQLSNGARMPRTSWHDVGKFDVVLPPENVAVAFNAMVAPLFERIHANIGTARTLAALRDTLLPRLISGKLRLPEAEAAIEAVA
ncbi:type I restriction enzyme S subunit [Luteimonas sp. J16]|uniref:restriction endonuclease subunit S n=1 Tax=unclassified Luteimonas TaxID=2629088 RepID=UPI00047DD547|nr:MULTISPECIES: restriction endonuclease subunit S [unclassified Luteimonas]TWG94591.1 type I restriction enzyme S subunit [Luteimonas sp. J16]